MTQSDTQGNECYEIDLVHIFKEDAMCRKRVIIYLSYEVFIVFAHHKENGIQRPDTQALTHVIANELELTFELEITSQKHADVSYKTSGMPLEFVIR